jgi:hypothetical protein
MFSVFGAVHFSAVRSIFVFEIKKKRKFPPQKMVRRKER